MSWILLAAAASAGTWTDVTGGAAAGDGAMRVVTLGGAVTESAVALGIGDRIVGVDTSSTFPASVNALPKVGYHRQLGAEGVLSLAPDLVLATLDVGPPGVLDQLRGAGVTVAVLPGEATVAGAVGRLEAIGALFDVDATAAVRRVEALPECSGPRPRAVFLFGHGGGLQVAGTGTAAHTMLGLGCAENVVTAYAGYRPLADEALASVAPEVIVTTDDVLASVGGEAGLAGLPAVQVAGSPKVVALDALLLLGFGPRTGEAATALAEALR